MKQFKMLSILFAANLILAGCGSQKEEVTVRYLNFKPEVADVWREIADIYPSETGVKVEILTAPSNCNEQTLNSEIAKKNAPTLFQINGPVGYQTWKNYCMDLSDSDLYSWVIDKNMCITGDDGGVYGIPYVVEGYGIIYNDSIMKKYFTLPTKSTSYSSMEDIKNFKILTEVTQDMTKHKVELGIDGVFASTSFRAGEEWRWQTHLMNLPVYYEYQQKGVSDLNVLDFSYGDNYKNILSYSWEDSHRMKVLDAVQKRVIDTKELIVIGYSFPYVNREMDVQIIHSMPKLNTIYVQDPNYDEIESRLRAIVENDNQFVDKDIKIKEINNRSQFYIPASFD